MRRYTQDKKCILLVQNDNKFTKYSIIQFNIITNTNTTLVYLKKIEDCLCVFYLSNQIKSVNLLLYMVILKQKIVTLIFFFFLLKHFIISSSRCSIPPPTQIALYAFILLFLKLWMKKNSNFFANLTLIQQLVADKC